MKSLNHPPQEIRHIYFVSHENIILESFSIYNSKNTTMKEKNYFSLLTF